MAVSDRISFRAEPSMRKLFRVHCLANGTTLTDVLTNFVKRVLSGEIDVKDFANKS